MKIMRMMQILHLEMESMTMRLMREVINMNEAKEEAIKMLMKECKVTRALATKTYEDVEKEVF